MKLTRLSFLPLFFVLLLGLFVNVGRVGAVSRKDFVSLSIALDRDAGFDDLAARLTALDFHNFTFIVWYNSAWAYILCNSTRVAFLKSYGELIPMFNYPQIFYPVDRKTWVDGAFADFNSYVGYVPKGFMSFSPDTYMNQYAYETYNCTYVQGYCFDQYDMDAMTMRGGWQLPYYSSLSHVLKPSDAQGLIVFPHVTWDWLDSFTVSHSYNTHLQNILMKYDVTAGKDYFLRLIDRSVTGCSPFGFASVQWEWMGLISDLGYQDTAFDWLDSLLENPLYTFWTYEDVAEWFLTNYASNPVYRVSFASPHSEASVEWYWSASKRVCRYGGNVMSYVDYGVPCTDKYRTEITTYGAGIDLTLYPCLTVDALGGGEWRFGGVGDGVAYSGNLADFGAASPVVFWYQDPIRFGLIGMALFAIACILIKLWKD